MANLKNMPGGCCCGGPYDFYVFGNSATAPPIGEHDGNDLLARNMSVVEFGSISPHHSLQDDWFVDLNPPLLVSENRGAIQLAAGVAEGCWLYRTGNVNQAKNPNPPGSELVANPSSLVDWTAGPDAAISGDRLSTTVTGSTSNAYMTLGFSVTAGKRYSFQIVGQPQQATQISIYFGSVGDALVLDRTVSGLPQDLPHDPVTMDLASSGSSFIYWLHAVDNGVYSRDAEIVSQITGTMTIKIALGTSAGYTGITGDEAQISWISFREIGAGVEDYVYVKTTEPTAFTMYTPEPAGYTPPTVYSYTFPKNPATFETQTTYSVDQESIRGVKLTRVSQPNDSVDHLNTIDNATWSVNADVGYMLHTKLVPDAIGLLGTDMEVLLQYSGGSITVATDIAGKQVLGSGVPWDTIMFPPYWTLADYTLVGTDSGAEWYEASTGVRNHGIQLSRLLAMAPHDGGFGWGIMPVYATYVADTLSIDPTIYSVGSAAWNYYHGTGGFWFDKQVAHTQTAQIIHGAIQIATVNYKRPHDDFGVNPDFQSDEDVVTIGTAAFWTKDFVQDRLLTWSYSVIDNFSSPLKEGKHPYQPTPHTGCELIRADSGPGGSNKVAIFTYWEQDYAFESVSNSLPPLIPWQYADSGGTPMDQTRQPKEVAGARRDFAVVKGNSEELTEQLVNATRTALDYFHGAASTPGGTVFFETLWTTKPTSSVNGTPNKWRLHVNGATLDEDDLAPGDTKPWTDKPYCIGGNDKWFYVDNFYLTDTRMSGNFATSWCITYDLTKMWPARTVVDAVNDLAATLPGSESDITYDCQADLSLPLSPDVDDNANRVP